MKLPDSLQKRLIQIFEKGADNCLGQLGKISGAAWGTDAIFLSDASRGQLEKIFPGSLEDCYGNWFTAPGAAFLVIFSRKPGTVMANRFTREASGPVDTLENRDAKAIAEISNILINGFVSALADVLDEMLILSAPQSMTDNKRDLLLRGIEKLPRPERLTLAGLTRLQSPGLVTEFSVITLLEEAVLAKI